VILVSALIWLVRMPADYAHVIRNQYRWSGYGDLSLLLPGN
jgi:S-adenosylmethionine:tRNA-ribosyltransferase-isomerase (queuine synthetase)